ncbi:hypothetical protein ACH5RR_032098 [Cinchona calisaya]|uniref:RNase H type-1 domain-containing protein n=1 Tax=Cinchona calisaya TaxID=153742 RepID=A0ABD2YIH4_9GENT
MANMEVKKKYIFKGEPTDVHLQIHRAMEEWIELEKLYHVEGNQSRFGTKEHESEPVWKPPDPGIIKINADAAICRTRMSSDAEVIEAQAIRKALIAAEKERWNNIEIQSDCKAVLDKIQSSNCDDAR